MTTLPPPEDNFDELAAQLDDIEEPNDAINFAAMDDSTLLNTWHRINDQLKQLREEMVPRTDRGRELHSFRTAARVIMADRGLI